MRLFAYRYGTAERAGLERDTEAGVERLALSALWSAWASATRQRVPDWPTLGVLVTGGYFQRALLGACLAYYDELAPEARTEFALQGDESPIAPIARPGKILAMAKNYRAHAAEFGAQAPETPVWFAKLPSAVIGPGEPIVLPAAAERVDHEIELACVIGRRGRRLTRDTALGVVAGYTIANDVTDRTRQGADRERGRPWSAAKGYDTFCPLGPYLVPAGVLADPGALGLTLSVNGATRQHGSTADCVHDLPAVLVAMSAVCTLLPGDIVLTGTPEGVGPLAPGDVVRATIDGLGTLENPVVAAEPEEPGA